MQDLIARNKAAFWTAALLLFGLAAVPSIVLVQSAQRYWRLLSGWDPGSLKATTTRHVPHRGGAASAQGIPQVHFVEFRLSAPKAKSVALAGEFNLWKPETLPLTKGAKGEWETLLPLPPGKYHYLFQVDGAWTPDPKAPSGEPHAGVPASVRQVP